MDALKEVDGQMFICADHGNAEQLIDETTGEPFYGTYNKSGTVYSCEC